MSKQALIKYYINANKGYKIIEKENIYLQKSMWNNW